MVSHQDNSPETQPQESPPKPAKSSRMGAILASALMVSALLVAFSCYIRIRDEQEAAEAAIAQAASVAHNGVIPSTESEAADRAEVRNAEQVNGMIAPSDEGEEMATSSASASQESAASAFFADDELEDDEAKISVDEKTGTVRFAFGADKIDVANGAVDALHDVLAGVQAGKKVALKGWLDHSSDAEHLSKERVFAVRDILLASGVPESQIQIFPAQKVSKNQDYQVEVLLQ